MRYNEQASRKLNFQNLHLRENQMLGKSSLINALMNRKSYARISATPGKTQTINFYTINEEMYLVDLQGMDTQRFLSRKRFSGEN